MGIRVPKKSCVVQVPSSAEKLLVVQNILLFKFRRTPGTFFVVQVPSSSENKFVPSGSVESLWVIMGLFQTCLKLFMGR